MPYTTPQIDRLLADHILPAGHTLTQSQAVCEAVARRKLYAWEDRAVRELHEQFEQAWRAIRTAGVELAERMKLTGKLTTINGGLRWRNTMADAIDNYLADFERQVGMRGRERAIDAFRLGYVSKAWAYNATTIETTPPQRVDSNRLSWSMIERDIQAEWEQRYGDSFGFALHTLFMQYRAKVRPALTNAVANQETAIEALNRVKALMGHVDGKALYFHAQMTVRTAIMLAANLGGLAFGLQVSPRMQEAVGGIALAALYLTAGDGRVCNICRPYAGRMWRLDTVAGLIGAGLTLAEPPQHYGCRCTLVYIPVPEQYEWLLPPDFPPGLTWAEYLVFEGLADVFRVFDNGGTLNSSQVGELRGEWG